MEFALATEDGFENSASGILDSTVRLHLQKRSLDKHVPELTESLWSKTAAKALYQTS
jgi:hypothetical protein